MSDKTLHTIGNAHLDPVWLWQWPEGFQEVKATFRSVLDLMKECDDFLFTASSAALYEWIEQKWPSVASRVGSFRKSMRLRSERVPSGRSA